MKRALWILFALQAAACSSDDGGGTPPTSNVGGSGGTTAGSGGTSAGGTAGTSGSGGTSGSSPIAGGWGVEACTPSPTELPTGDVFYVSPTGDDANPGTESAPWKSIAKANESLQAGESVVVRAGTYAEIINPENSGSSAMERIRYVAYPGETVELTGGNDGDSVVAIDNKDFISVDGFVLKQANPKGNEEVFADIRIRGNWNEILNCTVVNTMSSTESFNADIREIGIQILSGEDNLISGNRVEGLWFGVIVHNPSLRSSIRCNTLLTNYMDAVRFESRKNVMAGDIVELNDLGESATSDGVQFNGDFDLPPEELPGDTSSCGVIIRRNRIFGNAENGVDLKGTCHIVVEDNLIHGNIGNNDGSAYINSCSGELDDRCGGSAIMHGTGTSARDNVIRRNIIVDNMGGIGSDPTWRVYNNTIVANNRDYTGPNSEYVTTDKPFLVGLYGSGTIKNNLVGNHRDAETYINPDAQGVDGNLYFDTLTSQGPRFAVGVDPWSATSFDEWQSTSGQDLEGSVGAPGFVDPSGFDFHLTPGSEAIDRAIALTTTIGAGSGSEVSVGDAGFFIDGYGVASGDRIVIGDNAPVTVTHVDYDTNTLTVDASVTWAEGDGVQLAFSGVSGDVGALELE